MQIGKMVKKIAAISTGALMLGATLTGALAYNLADYPAPFLKSGALDNTVIVVGKAAATSDVVGAIDVAAALQAEAVSKTAVDVNTVVAPTMADAVKIEKSGNMFNYNDSIVNVQASALDDTDLPVMLAEGTFKDTKGENKQEETYTQSLSFPTVNVGKLDMSQPDGMKGGVYLEIPKNKAVYTYTLTFDTPITFGTATTDLEGNTIKIQGNTYTITEVHETGDALDKITLVAGDSTVWLLQDQPYTVGDHTVTVVNVDDTGDSCGINVDGTTKWVDNGATETINGMNVGVLDVKVVHAKDYDQDTCELSLGSSEIILEDGENVDVNGAEIQNAVVTITSASGEWNATSITFTSGKEDAGVNSDDIYLADKGAWTDPVFGNFKIAYEGTTGVYESMRAETSSEDATFTFVNNDGKTVEMPYHYASGVVNKGTDTDEVLLVPGETTTQPAEGTLLLYTTTGHEAHVLEITSLTCDTADKVTIKDVTYGTEYKDKAMTCGNNLNTVSLGSLGSIELALNDNTDFVNYTTAYGSNAIWTKYENTLSFASDTVVSMTEKTDVVAASVLTLNFTYDTSDEEMKVSSISGTDAGWFDTVDGDDDEQIARTDKGTLLKTDNKDDLWLDIQMPEDDVYGNVFVAPVKSQVSEGSSSGTITADKVNPFAVGLAVLDEDAAGMTKNMIVVGGPCVNTVAAEIMGNPTSCAAGFEAGKAMLKFYDRKGKAALLVAGYDAKDTVNAAYVLAQHKSTTYLPQFATLKDEVELAVTDMSKVVFTTTA